MNFGIIIYYSDLVGVYVVFIPLEDTFDELKSDGTSKFNVSRIPMFFPVAQES